VNLRLALVCGVVAGLLMAGVRATLATYQLVGSGDANAGYAAVAVLIAGMLVAAVVATLLQLAVLSGRPGRTGPVALAVLAVGVCAAVLGPATFFISMAIFAGACLYAIHAAAGGRSVPDAIAESCRLALAAPGPTAAAVATIAAGIALGAVAATLLASVAPFAGDLAAGLLGQLAVGYAAPRVTATFLKLHDGPEVS
jgi:hypothetical protein